MMRRRELILGGIALTMARADAQETPVTLRRGCVQGALVVGDCARPGSLHLNGTPLHVAADGRFAFGIEHDRVDPLQLEWRGADGGQWSRAVAVIARQYQEQRIDGLEEKYVSPPEDIVERIRAENALVRKVRERDSDLSFFAGKFDWPVAGIVTGVFGSRRILNGKPRRPHFGVDIAAKEGAPIVAPADGLVRLAEPDFYLTGGTSLLDHGHGVTTVYVHQSALKVKAGDTVERGQVIGLVGKTGRATGPHLHWGMNWFQTRLDPSLSTETPAPPRA